MTRSHALAHNRGVAAAIAFASALADDIRAKLADDPERYPAAVAALEVVIGASPRLMLQLPQTDEDGPAARPIKGEELAAFLNETRDVIL